MAKVEEKRLSPQDRLDQIATAEALSRKQESEAMILSGRAERSRDPASYEEELAARVKAGQEASAELERLQNSVAAKDLSGMSRGLSDSNGNFAANADVLTTGGVGVEGSNSKEESTEQAKTAEEAGTVVPPPAPPQPEVGKVQGGEAVVKTDFSKKPTK